MATRKTKMPKTITLVVSASIGTVTGHKSVEVTLNTEEWLNGDGVTLDRAALDEHARDVLFEKVISWDWRIKEEP